MIVLLSKTGFDSDFNLRRWPYALVFREPPPTNFGFVSKRAKVVVSGRPDESGRANFVSKSKSTYVTSLRISFFLSLSLSLSKKSLYLLIEHYYL